MAFYSRFSSSLVSVFKFSLYSGHMCCFFFYRYRVLELSSGMSDLGSLQWRHVGSMAIIRIVICLGLIRSIKSIEKVLII